LLERFAEFALLVLPAFDLFLAEVALVEAALRSVRRAKVIALRIPALPRPGAVVAEADGQKKGGDVRAQ
jgi:hypothetical protein